MKAISLIVIWTLFAQIVHGIHDKFIDVENYEGYSNNCGKWQMCLIFYVKLIFNEIAGIKFWL